jgi:hypothetical protein
MRQELPDIHKRVDQSLTVEVHGHVKCVVARSIEKRPGRQDMLRHVQAELAPSSIS